MFFKVISSKSFMNKEKSRELHMCNLQDDQGNIAVDVFTDAEYPAGTVLLGDVYINRDHKLSPRVIEYKK